MYCIVCCLAAPRATKACSIAAPRSANVMNASVIGQQYTVYSTVCAFGLLHECMVLEHIAALSYAGASQEILKAKPHFVCRWMLGLQNGTVL